MGCIYGCFSRFMGELIKKIGIRARYKRCLSIFTLYSMQFMITLIMTSFSSGLDSAIIIVKTIKGYRSIRFCNLQKMQIAFLVQTVSSSGFTGTSRLRFPSLNNTSSVFIYDPLIIMIFGRYLFVNI